MPIINNTSDGKRSRGLAFFSKLKSIMEARIVIGNVDNWITKTYQAGIKYLYTKIGQILLVMIAVFGFFAFISLSHQSLELMKSLHTASWVLLLISLPMLMVVLVLHELAHAYTTKAFGRIVHGFGLGWLWIGPIAFCDTSDMWLSSRRERIMVDLAGFYLQLILGGLASLAAITMSSPYLVLLLWYFSLFNYLAIISNLSPIIELDGYYALMDGLDTPHLKQEAVKWLIKNPFKKNSKKLSFKPEIIYWIICIIYLICSFFTSWFIFKHLLSGLIGVSNPIYSLCISSGFLLLSFIEIWAEMQRNQLEIKTFPDKK